MTDTSRLRISDPGDLVALVPYLLGFPPSESLVVVWLSGGRVVLTSRMDISMPRREVGELLERMRLRIPDDSMAILLGWTADRRLARRVVRHAAGSLPEEVVLDRLVCDGDRWWSLVCRDPGCCPRAGNPVPREAEAVALARALGLTSAESREAAVAVVEGPSPERAEELVPLAQDAVARAEDLDLDEGAELLERLVRELVARSEVPDDAGALELAALACVMDLNALRVAALVRNGIATEHAQVWERVVQVAPQELAPGPLAILGIAAWVAGRGAITTECCRRLDELDPDHPLLPVLAGAALGAWPPSVWEDLRGRVA